VVATEAPGSVVFVKCIELNDAERKKEDLDGSLEQVNK
jgi:hypothetical protein